MVSGLPEGLFFDLLSSEEVPTAYEIERAGARNRMLTHQSMRILIMHLNSISTGGGSLVGDNQVRCLYCIVVAI